MRCMECGENGHIKCTSIRRSGKVKINFKMKVDQIITSLTNLTHNNSSDEESVEEGDSLKEMELGCAACGSSKHDLVDCNYKKGN